MKKIDYIIGVKFEQIYVQQFFDLKKLQLFFNTTNQLKSYKIEKCVKIILFSLYNIKLSFLKLRNKNKLLNNHQM